MLNYKYKSMKPKKDYIAHFMLLLILTLLSVAILFTVSFTGYTVVHSAGGHDWENKIEVFASPDIQTITQHIVFGQYKPISCVDSIYVEAEGNIPITFTTENEIYDRYGQCLEADVTFDNIIYLPPEAKFSITGGYAAQSITYAIYYGKVIAPLEEIPEILPEQPIEQPVEEPIEQVNETIIPEQVYEPSLSVEREFSTQWWSSSWSYRKPIAISAPGTTLTDYQVSVTTDTAALVSAGKLQADCDDIRFVDYNDGTNLNYWIESGCNTSSTKFWVKVPTIYPDGKKIYMYYGNSGASAASNGDNTFMFFDDFNDNSLNTSK